MTQRTEGALIRIARRWRRPIGLLSALLVILVATGTETHGAPATPAPARSIAQTC